VPNSRRTSVIIEPIADWKIVVAKRLHWFNESEFACGTFLSLIADKTECTAARES
jgi:hypothetical protein